MTDIDTKEALKTMSYTYVIINMVRIEKSSM